RGGCRIIASEVTGIEVNTFDHTRPAESHNAPIVPGHAFPASLPPVHPFPMFIIFSRNKDRRFWIQHAFLRRKKVVTGRHRLGTEARVSKIEVTPREVRCIHPGYSAP